MPCTPTKVTVNLPEGKMESYLEAVMSIKSRVNPEITLEKILDSFAQKNGMTTDGMFNINGLTPEQLQRFRSLSGEDRNDADITQAFAGAIKYNRGNIKIIGVIPPSIAKQVLNKSSVDKYIYIGIVENKSRALRADELPPGKFNPDKPVYAQELKIFSDDLRSSIEMGSKTKEMMAVVWKKEFIKMKNSFSSKAGLVQDLLIKKAKNLPESKIDISAVNNAQVLEVQREGKCDFVLKLSFDCTYSIKPEFEKMFEEKKSEEVKTSPSSSPAQVKPKLPGVIRYH